jgi:hypothetical protein
MKQKQMAKIKGMTENIKTRKPTSNGSPMGIPSIKIAIAKHTHEGIVINSTFR